MPENPIQLFRSFSDVLDPQKLQQKFLAALLQLQNVERGSIWIKKDGRYVCIEAAGKQSEKVKGLSIDIHHPSIVGWVIENGKMTISDPTDDPRHHHDFEKNLSVKSRLILCFPLLLKDDTVYGAVQIIDTSPGKTRINLERSYLDQLQDLVNIGSIALGNAVVYNRQALETETLRKTLATIREEGILIGQSPVFHQCMELIRSYARTDYPVLITGESGTGKELAARRIHQLSDRRQHPFLVQNCSTIPETLLESELFGYKQGAFSGAGRDKTGLFQAAHEGTVFLDEIGDMPLNLQARILRVIQNNEIKPLGQTTTTKVDIKIISATNKNVKHLVGENAFRKDLFYRLSVLPLHLPSLRERPEDIPILAGHFLKKEAAKLDMQPKTISSQAMTILQSHPWPGNIRELENLVRYLLVVSNRTTIEPDDLPDPFRSPKPPSSSETLFQQETIPCQENPDLSALSRSGAAVGEVRLFGSRSWEEVERAYMQYRLQQSSWNISRAASDAGVNRSTFTSRMKRLGLRRPE